MSYRLLSIPVFSCLTTLASSASAVDAPDGRATPADAEPGLRADAHVNAAGLLQFGLTPTFELGAGHWGALAQFRFFNTGLLANSTIPTSGEHLAFSYGIAVGGRWYSASHGPLTGFNAGAMLEYLHIRNEDTTEREAYVTGLVVPQIAGGYRWKFDWFLVGVGATAGYAFVVSKKTEDLSGGADPYLLESDATSQVYGSGLLDVGVFF